MATKALGINEYRGSDGVIHKVIYAEAAMAEGSARRGTDGWWRVKRLTGFHLFLDNGEYAWVPVQGDEIKEEPFEGAPQIRKVDVWLNLYADGRLSVHDTWNNAEVVGYKPVARFHLKRTVVEGEGLTDPALAVTNDERKG